MSYRELRNFTEMLRCLGYPRLISMENFKTPNFELVAEILIWLIQRYDHNASIPIDIDTEQDRIIFIKSSAQFIATKTHIKLNTKRLYMADGYAVKELLKFTSLLCDAMKERNEGGDGDSNSSYINYTTKAEDLKAVRQISSEVTSRGANLYQLLSQELQLREARFQALARPLEITTIEKNLKSTIGKVEDEIKKTLSKLDNVAADEANLEAKIEKRKSELERASKRMATLQNVRPAFMDEFERLEQVLKQQYDDYVIKFRNMTFLEHQMENHKKNELLKMNENEDVRRKIQDRLRAEEQGEILSGPFADVTNRNFGEEFDSDADSPTGFLRPDNPTHKRSNNRGMYLDDSDDLGDTSDDDDDEDDVISDDDDDLDLMTSQRRHREDLDDEDADLLDDDDDDDF